MKKYKRTQNRLNALQQNYITVRLLFFFFFEFPNVHLHQDALCRSTRKQISIYSYNGNENAQGAKPLFKKSPEIKISFIPVTFQMNDDKFIYCSGILCTLKGFRSICWWAFCVSTAVVPSTMAGAPT